MKTVRHNSLSANFVGTGRLAKENIALNCVLWDGGCAAKETIIGQWQSLRMSENARTTVPRVRTLQSSASQHLANQLPGAGELLHSLSEEVRSEPPTFIVYIIYYMCSDWNPWTSQCWPNLLLYHLVLSTIPIEVDFCAFTRICQEILPIDDFGDHYSRTLLYPIQWARLALIVQQTNCLLVFYSDSKKSRFLFLKRI